MAKTMTIDNEELRNVLRRIEARACAALANQPHDDAECASGLTKAVREIGEIAGAVAFCAVVAVLMWMWCAATPPQMSAECDLAAEEAGL